MGVVDELVLLSGEPVQPSVGSSTKSFVTVVSAPPAVRVKSASVNTAAEADDKVTRAPREADNSVL
jgi:hypothetical protein